MRYLINNKILEYLKNVFDIHCNLPEDFNIQIDRIDKYFLNNKIIREEILLEIYHQLFNYEVVDLDKENLDYNLVKLFSSHFIDKYLIIPIKKEENIIYIGITDPFDIVNLNKIACFVNNLEIKYLLCSKSKLLKIKEKVFSTHFRKALIAESINKVEKVQENEDLNDTTSSFIVKLVDSIIIEAICLLASDIHLEPFEENVRIRYRIDGNLVDSANISKNIYKSISSRIKILANLDISKSQISQDGRISYFYNELEYDLRVSTVAVINGERIVIRILDSNSFNYNLDNIGFSIDDLDYIKKVINSPYGIILLTGPTGSGKSTTLYVFLKELIKKNINIMTIEDPVEYNIYGINQIGINNKSNITFNTGLKAILRQDPNVIMIGEIRDEETASIAVRASITGHLVFSTLHTNTATSSISRLIDMGVKPYFLLDALTCVINQRLIKKLCPHCKEKYSLYNKEKEIFNVKDAYKPTGCPACNNTGYKGRIMVYEILKVNDKIKKLIAEGVTRLELDKFIKENCFTSITDNTKKLVKEGLTSIEELININYDLNE